MGNSRRNYGRRQAYQVRTYAVCDHCHRYRYHDRITPEEEGCLCGTPWPQHVLDAAAKHHWPSQRRQTQATPTETPQQLLDRLIQLNTTQGNPISGLNAVVINAPTVSPLASHKQAEKEWRAATHEFTSAHQNTHRLREEIQTIETKL